MDDVFSPYLNPSLFAFSLESFTVNLQEKANKNTGINKHTLFIELIFVSTNKVKILELLIVKNKKDYI